MPRVSVRMSIVRIAMSAQTTWLRYCIPVRSDKDGAADQKIVMQAKMVKANIHR